jgi:RNA polymerase sigma-70 factor (ECF subfamily)
VLRNREAQLTQVRAWLYTTARNLCLNRQRSRSREKARYRALELVRGPAEPTPEQHLHERATQAALDRAVSALPGLLSEVFHLRASGMSYEEMAQVLEIPLGTVKSRMHEMVHHLRKDLRTWTAS